METRGDGLLPISLEPCPTIEAYKKDVDRSLLRENLRLTTEQRVKKMLSALQLVEALHRSRSVARQL